LSACDLEKHKNFARGVADGTIMKFYPEAEAILAKLPRRGIPMILREIKTRNGVAFKPYSYSGFEKIVQRLRKRIDGLPSYFTASAGGNPRVPEAPLGRVRTSY